MTNEVKETIDKDKPGILNEDYYVELNILVGKTSVEEMEQYEKELDDYELRKQEAESMAMPFNQKRPRKPKFDIDYRKQRINFGIITVLGYYEEYDEDRDTSIVVLDYINNILLEPKQLNIKITLDEWENMLKGFGANIV